jgi:hypothetical protein
LAAAVRQSALATNQITSSISTNWESQLETTRPDCLGLQGIVVDGIAIAPVEPPNQLPLSLNRTQVIMQRSFAVATSFILKSTQKLLAAGRQSWRI